MRQLDFAAQPNYNQEFREVQRLFRQNLAVPMRASLRALLEQTMRDAVANQVQADWHERKPEGRQVFLRGVSTRQTGAVLATLCGEPVSATSVSRLTGMLEASAQAFHARELTDHYRYLLCDGVYLRIREAGGVRRRVALCVYGISGAGVRELIDFRIARAESQSAWEALLNSLYER